MGRLFGVAIDIHWSLFAMFLYYVLRGADLGYSLVTLGLFVVLPMVLLFASVVAHEYGHVFAARHFGLPVGNMLLTPVGGMVMVAQGRTPTHELVVALAGPAVNLALALVAGALYLALGGPPALGLVLPMADRATFLELWQSGRITELVLFDFVQSQMTLFLFNVVCAAYPMDGGRALMAVLWRRMGFHRALVRSCTIAKGIAVVLGLVGLATLSPMTVLIAVLIWAQAASTIRQAPMLPDPGPSWSRGSYEPAAPQRARTAKKRGPWPWQRWLDERREAKLRALLARAEQRGVHTLTAAERAWLERARNRRRG